MTLVEIEARIRLLNSEDKIQLIQSIVNMLKEHADEYRLLQLTLAAETAVPSDSGPLEAYEAAEQLQNFFKDNE